MHLDRLAAPLFVLLWSTGFLGAKLGLPHAEPMTFLALRFAIVAVALFAWAVLMGKRWPSPRQAGQQAIVGALVHFAYLGGVFAAIDLGVEAGLSALIVGLQPILTAFLAVALLGEAVSRTQWLGMAFGLAGVSLVVIRKLDAGLGSSAGIVLCVVALGGIALGSILQKRGGADTPMISGNAIQFAVAAVLCTAVAFGFETMVIEPTPAFLFALGWLVIVLSFGAVSLLYVLIRRGAAAKVASLFFLVPPVTALIAWPMFGETMTWIEVAGLATTSLGVLLVIRPQTFSRD